MDDLRRTGPEHELWKLANMQHGLLRYEDLVKHGLSGHAIDDRIQQCRLTRLHHKVFALGHTALRPEGLWLAGQWGAGADAVLSHQTAAAFHRMLFLPPGERVHVSTTGEGRTRDDLRVHRVRYLDDCDIFHARLFRVTTIPRTVVDLADELSWSDYRAAVDSLPRLHVGSVRAAQARAPGRRGAGLVTRLIDADDAHTRSEFERRYRRFCRSHRLDAPDHHNRQLAGHLADCVYERARLVVELDGRTYHQRRDQMRADRRRDTDYQLAGYRILRLVWDDLHRHAAGETAERVRQMLAFGSCAA